MLQEGGTAKDKGPKLGASLAQGRPRKEACVAEALTLAVGVGWGEIPSKTACQVSEARRRKLASLARRQ